MNADLDEDGYPTEATLARIREWPWKDCRGLLEFVKSIWWPDTEWGWTETPETDGVRYAISTGGWSGNEDVIGTMEGNQMFWMLSWHSSRRGGHYEFCVFPMAEDAEAKVQRPPRDQT
jgi:hypothetical protein